MVFNWTYPGYITKSLVNQKDTAGVKWGHISQSEAQGTTRVWPMLRQVRFEVDGCIISSIVLRSLYGLMTLYLNHQRVSDGEIGYWMAVMVSAGILGKWPVGRLADRFGRLQVLRV